MKRYCFNGVPILTNSFRDDKYYPHHGEDYALEHRTAIVAMADGAVSKMENNEDRNWRANTQSDPFLTTVQKAKLGIGFRGRSLTNADYGNFVKIYHGKNKDGNQVHTLYAHLDEVVVHNGQSVKEGQLVGYADSTGNSTGNHVHMEVRVNDTVVDPAEFDYTFDGQMGEEKFYPFEVTAEVANWVDVLYVRSGPATSYSLSGSRELTGGDEFRVKGFVKGERVKYGNINTQFWWVSSKGNYVWAGGTTVIPTLDNYPESISNKFKQGEHMQELKEKLAELEAKRNALTKEASDYMAKAQTATEEKKQVEDEIQSTEDEIKGLVEKEEPVSAEPELVEPVEESGEKKDEPVEEVTTVVEEDEEDSVEEEVLEEMLKAKLEEVELLRDKLGF